MEALTWVPAHFGNSKANSKSQQFDSSSTANILETTIISVKEAKVTATHSDINRTPRVLHAMETSQIGLLQPQREYVYFARYLKGATGEMSALGEARISPTR